MKNRFIKFLLSTIAILIIILIADFTYTLVSKKKPLLLIKETGNKYSSILYDVYICNGQQIIKFKNKKYECRLDNNNNNDDGANGNSDNNNVNDNNNNNDNVNDNNNVNNNNNNNSNNNNTNNNSNNNNSNSNNNSTNNNNSSNNNNNNNSNDNKFDNNINKPTDKFDIENSSNDIIIINKSNPNCPSAIEYYYEDKEYKYYFTCIISKDIFVVVNNKTYNIKDALNNKIVTMDALIKNGFSPLKEKKNLQTQ